MFFQLSAICLSNKQEFSQKLKKAEAILKFLKLSKSDSLSKATKKTSSATYVVALLENKKTECY